MQSQPLAAPAALEQVQVQGSRTRAAAMRMAVNSCKQEGHCCRLISNLVCLSTPAVLPSQANVLFQTKKQPRKLQAAVLPAATPSAVAF
jgi:hypothetical protein